MKDQYIGDKTDYVKYSFLRHILAAGLHLSINWMWTPNDGSSDGNGNGYLQYPRRWRHYDAAVFDVLTAAVHTGNRTLAFVERSGILDPATLLSRPCPAEPNSRQCLFDDFVSQLDCNTVAFLDPDNGLEVASCAYGRRGSEKYLYWHELLRIWPVSGSIVICQHFPRVKRDRFLRQLGREIESRLSESTVWALSAPRAAFLLAVRNAHENQMVSALTAMADVWRDEIQALGLLSANESRLGTKLQTEFPYTL
jgi:hypothetical protein